MHAHKREVPVAFEQDRVSSRQVQWGEMNIAFEDAPAGADSRSLFKGLPGDSCQCPHWGYVIKGRMRVIYPDREEVVGAGEAYYLAPGHTVVCEEDGELIEFSPKGEYQRMMEAVARNMQAAQVGS